MAGASARLSRSAAASRGVSVFQDGARQQALGVADAAQAFAQPLAPRMVAGQVRHRLVAEGDRLGIAQRTPQPFAQQPPARRRGGAVEHAQKGGAAAALAGCAGGGGARLDGCQLGQRGGRGGGPERLQVGQRRGVQDQPVARLADAQRLDVRQVAALRFARIGQRRRGRQHSRLLLQQAEAAQRRRSQVALQQVAGAPRIEQPVARQRCGAGALALRPFAHRRRHPVARQQHFARPQERQVVRGLFGGAPAAHEEGAGRDVEEGARSLLALPRDGGKQVVFAAVQQVGIGQRAGRHHPRHFAAHQPLGLGRVLHLVADRHLQARRQELHQVGVQGVVRHAAHRRLAVAAALPGGQLHLQDRRRLHRVVKEHLEKVAHAVQHDRIRVPRLDLKVLAQHRRQLHRRTPLCHRRRVYRPANPILVAWQERPPPARA